MKVTENNSGDVRAPASVLEPRLVRVRVWDLPTRLFHWALVLCVTGSIVSAKIGGNAMDWHLRFGYAVLTLLAFRLLWGVLGGRWSRFSSFVYGPAALWRYVRRRPRPDDRLDVGHNPLGGLAVLAMLAWLLLQVGSGLIADDEIATTGPLARFVRDAVSHVWTAYHKSLGQWGVYVLVALHVAAVTWYRLRRRQDLLTPMLSGDKQLRESNGVTPASNDGWAMRLLALLLLVGCAAAVAWIVSLGDG